MDKNRNLYLLGYLSNEVARLIERVAHIKEVPEPVEGLEAVSEAVNKIDIKAMEDAALVISTELAKLK
jgi:hypothetical protein